MDRIKIIYSNFSEAQELAEVYDVPAAPVASEVMVFHFCGHVLLCARARTDAGGTTYELLRVQNTGFTREVLAVDASWPTVYGSGCGIQAVIRRYARSARSRWN